MNAGPRGGVSTGSDQDALGSEFNISVLNLLPLVLLLIFTIGKTPPFPAILGAALFAGILASVTEPDAVKAFVGEPGLGAVSTGIKAIFAAMGPGFVSVTGVAPTDEIFSRGRI